MTYDAKELAQYPEIMNKEQMRKVCHISKRTAHYLLQFNLIPHVCTGKKTRCYAIKKKDVIDFMINREVNPSRYIVPTSWYKYGNEDVKPYKIRIQPPLPNDPQKTRRYYESKLASYNREYDGYVFVDVMGNIFNPRNLSSNFSKLLELKGLRHIRFHDLRHSCASLLLANDVPMKQIQEWLGHSDISTTANIYSHLDYKSKLTSANVMDNVLTLPETEAVGWQT